MKNFKVTFGTGTNRVQLHHENLESFAQFVEIYEKLNWNFTDVSKIETYDFTVSSIQKALNSVNFCLDPYSIECYLVERAQHLGYVARLSHTQAQWTDEGLEKAKKELEL